MQPGEITGLDRMAIGIIFRHAGFLRQIAVIIEKDREERQIMFLRRAIDRRDRIIIERTIADQTDDRPVGICGLYPERG